MSRRPDETVEVTVILKRWNAGDPLAREELIDFMYPALKRMAQARMRSERGDHTLQATALVSEFFLQLARREDVIWQNREHFLATAAKAMKRLLIDHARARRAAKREHSSAEINIEIPDMPRGSNQIDILDFNMCLDRLWEKEPRMAQVVELHAFGGLTHAEIGGLIGVDQRTVKRDWRFARTWILDHMNRGRDDASKGLGTN